MKSNSSELSKVGTEIDVTERIYHGIERADYTEIYRMEPDEAYGWIQSLSDLCVEARANIAKRDGDQLTELKKKRAQLDAEIKRLSEGGR